MARGAITSEGSGGENIHHFSTIKIRATGQGAMRIAVHSLDFVRTKVLVPIPLKAQSRIQGNRLINFVDQRVSFEIATLDMNEYVRINRIVVYMKELYTSHPSA